MTHQAIARKWRPRRFEEISGQTHVTRTLQNAIRLDRVHHAFLLTGTRGVGKTSAARILARALNCETGPAENPCNECSACREMLSGSFPDLIEIDAASHNSVDNIRDLVEKVQYTPQRGRYKIYIIDEVHMVSKQGFNALLKTLEEPPAHVIFILATTDPQQLLDTVVSRCQRFDFKMIPVRTIYDRLKFVTEQEGVQVPDSSLKVIAREGGGSMRDAQSLLDQVLSFSGDSVTEQEVAEILGFIDRSILYGILENTLSQDPGSALTNLSKVAVYGYDVRTFANQLLEAVRNVALVVQVPDAEKLLDLPDEEIQRLGGLAQNCDASLLSQQFDILAQAVDGIARSEQPMLLLEMAAVKMASVRPLVPVEKMLGRLEALERRLRRGGAGGGGGAPGTERREASPEQASGRSEPHYSSAPPPMPPMPESEELSADPEPTNGTPTPSVEPAPIHSEGAVTPQAAAPASAPEAGADVLDSLFNYKRSGQAEAATSKAAATPEGTDFAPAPEPEPEPESVVIAEPTDSEAARGVEAEESPIAARIETAPAIEVDAPPPQREDPPGGDLCDAVAWRRFVHALADSNEIAPLQALLATSGFMSSVGDDITVGFHSEPTLRQAQRLAEEPDFLARAAEQFGDQFKLRLVIDRAVLAAPSLSDELQRIRGEHQAQLESAARQHPAVARALAAFPGATIGAVDIPELKEIKDVH
jgi:DNA polymerase-3 subunit gamma/tau